MIQDEMGMASVIRYEPVFSCFSCNRGIPQPMTEPTAAPTSTSVGKCLPAITRNTLVTEAADNPAHQNGVIHLESGSDF